MNNFSKEDVVSNIVHNYLAPKNPIYRIKYFYVESKLNWDTQEYFDGGRPSALLKVKHKNIIIEGVKGIVYTYEEYNKLKEENAEFELKKDDVKEKNNFLYLSYSLRKSILKESFIEKWKSLEDRTIRDGEAIFVLTDVERLE